MRFLADFSRPAMLVGCGFWCGDEGAAARALGAFANFFSPDMSFARLLNAARVSKSRFNTRDSYQCNLRRAFQMSEAPPVAGPADPAAPVEIQILDARRDVTDIAVASAETLELAFGELAERFPQHRLAFHAMVPAAIALQTTLAHG